MVGSKSKEEKNNHQYGHYLKFILLAFLATLFMVAYFVWQFMQKPVSSKVYTRKDASPVVIAAEAYERFEGKYFSFRHSSDYSVKNHEDTPEANGIFLETAFLSSHEVNSKKIAMTVESLIGRNVEDSANYNLRKTYPNKYREEKFSIGEISGTAFTAIKLDTYEKVIFIQRENYLAEIALTGPLLLDGSMGKEFEDIIKSIQWKK